MLRNKTSLRTSAGPVRRWLLASLLIPLWGWVAAAPAVSQDGAPTQNPGLAQGSDEDSVFQMGEIDSVNLFNGNLSINLPLGSTYSVGGPLSYGLGLSYNSGANWDSQGDEDARCQPGAGNPNVDFTVYYPSKVTNAGVGWTVSLGRLIPPNLANDTQLRMQRWTYISGEGHRRGFFETLHEGVGAAPNIRYTNDGSYLRLRQNVGGCHNPPAGGGTCHVLDMPDGTFQEFHEVGDGPGFRPTYFGDPFGNWVEVDYDGGDWKIEDMHGRVQRVIFENGSNGQSRVDRVEVTAFGDAPGSPGAVYDFSYTTRTVDRHQFDHYNSELNCSLPGPYFIGSGQLIPPTVTVDVLTGIEQPDDSVYGMTYYDEDVFGDFQSGPLSGALASLNLPTGAEYRYKYNGRYGMRVVNRVDVATLKPGDRVLGVAEKRRVEDGTLTGFWDYDHSFSIYNSETDPYAIRNIPCYRTTEVRFFDREPNASTQSLLWDRYFFASADQGGWKNFRGMGFTPCLPDDPDGTNYTGPALSQQQLDSDGNVLRETYVLYDIEPGFHGALYEKNFRLREQILEYHDDLDAGGDPRWVRHTWGYDSANQVDDPADYDGRGHFRTYRIDSNFHHGRQLKESYQRYGVQADGTLTGLGDAPLSTDPWILNTFDTLRTTSGSGTTHQANVIHCFDDQTGFLKGRRVLADSSNGTGDIITQYEETGGNMTEERYYGGDFVDPDGNGDDDLCAVTVDATYEIQHQYTAGVLRKSDYMDGSDVLLTSLDLDIDVASGLPKTQRDASGIATDLVYDDMGRLIKEAPSGRAVVFHTYRFPTAGSTGQALEHDSVSCAGGSSTQCSGTDVLAEQRRTFDRLGRPVLEQRRVPGADGTGSRLIERSLGYDALGRVTGQGEWRDPGQSGFQFTTAFQGYDRFGRPAAIEQPDGTQTTFTYTGDRVLTRSVDVQGDSGTLTATVTEVRDAHGRLVLVQEPSGTNGSMVDTTYEYDEGDRLIQVCLGDPDQDGTNNCTGQQRKFAYDDRGLLMQEEHPELGAAGSTSRWIRYYYDALGKPLVRSLPGDHLDRNYVYDAAGRLVQVLRPVAISQSFDERILQEYFYRRPGPCGGLIDQAKQHNRLPVPGSEEADRHIAVTETFVYDSADACRLSDYGVRASHGNGFRAGSFTTRYTYNDLDDVVSMQYPDCVGPGCSGNPSQITYSVPYGALTAVGNVATLTYHPTGQIHQVRHGNGVLDTFERSATAWKPLHRITVSNLANSADWIYGPFQFDGAQNIYQIDTPSGPENFGYDRVGRLTSSSVRSTAGLKTQDLTYDIYGNITELDSSDHPNLATAVNFRNRLDSHGAAYDEAGNVTALTLGGSSFTYRRDAMNHLVRLSGGGVDRSHLYTASGERLATFDLVAGTEDWTPRDLGQRLLSRFQRSDGLVFDWDQDYMHAGSHQVAGAQPDGSDGEILRHFHLDHLGTTRLITDANAQVVTRNNFYAFGGYTTGAVEGAEALQFTGHERDDLGGNDVAHLDYMHARYYTPHLGRFLGVDPDDTTMDPAAPQSFNRNAYAMNSPLRYRDPNGEAIETPWDALNVGLGVASLTANIASGNVGGALLDAAGLLYDATATAVPGLPAGAGSGLKAWRAGRVIRNAADDVVEVAADVLPKQCFPAGTEVWTTDGLMPIETVQPGQQVACADTAAETWTFCTVEERLEHDYTGTLVTLVVEGDIVQATGDHPFWVVSGQDLLQRPIAVDAGQDAWIFEDHGRWVEAKDIVVGDAVWLTDGHHVEVTATSSLDAALPVFNLRVADLQTFSVGSPGILVHNRAMVARNGGSKSVEEMANDLREVTDKPRVSIKSGDRQIDIDLWSVRNQDGHFDKATGQRIKTPHVVERKLHRGPNGKVSADDGTMRRATPDDIRTARKILERREQ